MSDRPRKHFDIRIEMLSEQYVEEAASLHRICFPDKVETLLGQACVCDVYRDRFLGPRPDTYCLIALHKPDGKLAGYLYGSDLVPQSSSPHAFINKRVLMRHLIRRMWFSPPVWKWFLHRFSARKNDHHNEGSVVPIPPWGSVAKMLGLHPDFRGGNVGVDLMLAIEDEARRRGARRLYGLVERSNIKAEKLYASIGWVRTSPDTDRWQIFSMHKDLCADPERAAP